MPPQRDLGAFLWDIHEAAEHVTRFVAGKSLDDYRADVLLKSAVERQFEIIGEALSQALRVFPDVAPRIPEARQIIAFRNVLAHAYAFVDDAVVWGVIEQDLPTLRLHVQQLMDEALPEPHS